EPQMGVAHLQIIARLETDRPVDPPPVEGRTRGAVQIGEHVVAVQWTDGDVPLGHGGIREHHVAVGSASQYQRAVHRQTDGCWTRRLRWYRLVDEPGFARFVRWERVEHNLGGAHAYTIPGRQGHGRLQRLAVEERPVGAAEVVDHGDVAGIADLGMAARDVMVADEGQAALGQATDGERAIAAQADHGWSGLPAAHVDHVGVLRAQRRLVGASGLIHQRHQAAARPLLRPRREQERSGSARDGGAMPSSIVAHTGLPRKGIRMLTEDRAEAFEAHRPHLFGIAYRMLGSAMEAEDMVQEAYLRYQATPPETIRSERAFLSTVVTRLCLDRLKSARAQRESYVGPWLPEPVPTVHL